MIAMNRPQGQMKPKWIVNISVLGTITLLHTRKVCVLTLRVVHVKLILFSISTRSLSPSLRTFPSPFHIEKAVP